MSPQTEAADRLWQELRGWRDPNVTGEPLRNPEFIADLTVVLQAVRELEHVKSDRLLWLHAHIGKDITLQLPPDSFTWHGQLEAVMTDTGDGQGPVTEITLIDPDGDDIGFAVTPLMEFTEWTGR